MSTDVTNARQAHGMGIITQRFSVIFRERPCQGTPFDFVPKAQGLYEPGYEVDACGVGQVADLSGTATRQTVTDWSLPCTGTRCEIS